MRGGRGRVNSSVKWIAAQFGGASAAAPAVVRRALRAEIRSGYDRTARRDPCPASVGRASARAGARGRPAGLTRNVQRRTLYAQSLHSQRERIGARENGCQVWDSRLPPAAPTVFGVPLRRIRSGRPSPRKKMPDSISPPGIGHHLGLVPHATTISCTAPGTLSPATFTAVICTRTVLPVGRSASVASLSVGAATARKSVSTPPTRSHTR